MDLIFEGESSTIEFKRKINDPFKIAKEICAFANSRGGYLIVGVDDDGRIVGVKSEKSEVDAIEVSAGFHVDPPVRPKIEIIEVEYKDVIVAFIPEGIRKPYTIELEDKDTGKKFRRAYIRLGEKSVIASREMYRLLSEQNDPKRKLNISIGDRERRLFNYLENYERATVYEFSKLVNISKRRAERILIKLVRAGVIQIHNDMNNDYFTLI